MTLESWLKPALMSELQQSFLPKYQVPWNSLELTAKNKGLFNKRIGFSSTEPLCFKTPSIDACFEEIDLVFFLKTSDLSIEIINFVAKGGKQSIQVSQQQGAQENLSESLIQYYIQLFNEYRVMLISHWPKKLDLSLPDIQIISGQQQTRISIHFDQHHLQFKLGKDELLLDLKTKITKSLNFKDFNLAGFFFVSEKKMNFDLNSSGIQWGKDSPLSLNVSSDKPKSRNAIKITSDLLLFLDDKNSKLTFNSLKLKSSASPFVASQIQCRISFVLDPRNSSQISCPQVHLKFKKNWLAQQIESNHVKKVLPSGLDFQVEGFVNEGPLVSGIELSEPIIHFSFSKISAQSHFLQVEGQSHMRILQGEKGFVTQVYNSNIKAQINSFQKIVRLLENSNLAIPAPFNTLEGFVKMNITQPEIALKASSAFKADMQVRLTQKNRQRIWFTASSSGQLDGKFNLDTSKSKIHVDLERFWLHLPPFDPLVGIPPVTRDSRIKKTITKKKTKTYKKQIPIKVSLVSQSKDSIRIYYKLFEPYLAGALDLNISKEGLYYRFTNHKDLKISYLSRETTLKKVNLLKPKGASNSTELDILSQFDISQYIISLNILGPVASPRVIMSSKPPLPREDIISLLIYKRTTSELTSFESESVGSTEAAIADRAIGLFGLWAFSSTPIESVSYDSKSQTYQARLSLPGKINMTIGTNWEQERSLGLGRRIGAGWVLATEYELDGDEQVGNVFIQKEFTY